MRMASQNNSTDSNKKYSALARISFFAFSTLVYIKIISPFFWSFVYDKPFVLTDFSGLKYQLDNWLAFFLITIIIMELAFSSRTKLQYFLLAIFYYFVSKIMFLVSALMGSFPMLPNPKYLHDSITTMFSFTAKSLPVQIIGILFPIFIGAIAAMYWLPRDGNQVSIKTSWKVNFYLALMLMAPFVICWFIVFATGYLFGLAAFVPYFFLIPWMLQIKLSAVVIFLGIVVLNFRASQSFVNWYCMLTAALPALIFLALLQFREEYTILVSLVLFACIVMIWKYSIRKVLQFGVSAQ